MPTEIAQFLKIHKERCGKEPGRLALAVQADVDMLQFHAVESEADRDQHRGGPADGGDPACSTWGQEDLQLLLVQKPDDKLDLLIYDPMPGGSGLLEQMLSRWQELIATAKELLAGCVQGCETACYACLKTFRNQFYHDLLNRHEALELMDELDHDARRRTGTSRRSSRRSSRETARHRTSPKPGSPEPSRTNTISRQANAASDRHDRRVCPRSRTGFTSRRRWPSISTA